VVYVQRGGGKAGCMTDQSDGASGSSARGDAAWKEATDSVALRNQQAQKAGREKRLTYERKREDARRAAEARSDAKLLGRRRTS
jgi:hypothetical protein